jgi:oxygen-dependent protoporphyrinogen oxidase
MTPPVVIVGAGISGLALAYRLQQAAPYADITVLEERQRLGGSICTTFCDGFRVECGPNGFLDNNPATFDLCRDLGLTDRLIPGSEAARRHRYLFTGGKLRPVPRSVLGFVKSPILSWRGKLNLFAEPIRRRRSSIDDESIHSFLTRRTGHEAAEVFGDALVTGIYAGNSRLLSARACFPRLTAMEDRYRSLLLASLVGREKRQNSSPPKKETTMWSFREGLQVLVETLAAKLTRPPQLGVAIRRVTRTSTSWQVHASSGLNWEADMLVLACPAYQQACLLEQTDTELAGLIRTIPYNRIAVVALGYLEQDMPFRLDGFGFLANPREGLDLLGAQWCSSIYPDRAPAGTVLIRAMCGGWDHPEITVLDDDRLIAAVRAGLKSAMNITAGPMFHHIVRWDRAIPQYLLGHTERVDRIEKLTAQHPGLVLTGNAYHGVALNDCSEQAQRLAKQMAPRLRVALASP